MDHPAIPVVPQRRRCRCRKLTHASSTTRSHTPSTFAGWTTGAARGVRPRRRHFFLHASPSVACWSCPGECFAREVKAAPAVDPNTTAGAANLSLLGDEHHEEKLTVPSRP